jgi:hypothetical protein
MTATKASYRESMEAMIREDFKDHVATVSTCQDHVCAEQITVEWRHPKHFNYRIVYVMRGGTLLAYGDCGDAVYHWAQKLTPEWLGGLNLDYFAGKVSASESKRGKMWDDETARAEFKSLMESRLEDFPENSESKANRHIKAQILEGIEQANDSDDGSFCDPTPFYELLTEHGYDAEYVQRGYVIDSTIMRHFYGLKMAAEKP